MHCNCFSGNIYVEKTSEQYLAIATHRKLKKVSDRTSTQVITQMINKCKIKMIQEELYNVRDLPRRGDWKNSKRDTVAL